MEINNPTDKEIKLMLMKTLTELDRRTDEHSENVDREIESTKEKSQS